MSTCHVLDWSSNPFGLDSVDLPKRKAEKSIACTLAELRGEYGGQFDRLVFDTETTKRDIVCANNA